MPVASQSRGVTEPQRDKGDRRYATVDEVFSVQQFLRGHSIHYERIKYHGRSNLQNDVEAGFPI